MLAFGDSRARNHPFRRQLYHNIRRSPPLPALQVSKVHHKRATSTAGRLTTPFFRSRAANPLWPPNEGRRRRMYKSVVRRPAGHHGALLIIPDARDAAWAVARARMVRRHLTCCARGSLGDAPRAHVKFWVRRRLRLGQIMRGMKFRYGTRGMRHGM